jgi:formylglycine-generating enzyme required for sulfatase activity
MARDRNHEDKMRKSVALIHLTCAVLAGYASAMTVDPFSPNTVVFDPVKAKAVRFVITETKRGQPCIDELEVYGPRPGKNFALNANGAVASASGCLPGHAEKHRIEHLNDGLYGNAKSWIAAKSTGWAQIEFPKVVSINRIVFSRDRNGKLSDRIPDAFEIQVSPNGKQWTTVRKLKVDKVLTVPKVRVDPCEVMLARLATEFHPAAIRRAVADLLATHSGSFRQPAGFEATLASHEQQLPKIKELLGGKDANGRTRGLKLGEEALAFQRRVLLANPLLDVDRILVLRRDFPGGGARTALSGKLGFVPQNFVTQTDIPRKDWDNEIAVLTDLRGTPRFERVHKPETGRIVRDLHLSFDAKRVLFSSRGKTGRWSVREVGADGKSLQTLTPDTYPDLDYFGACYLPNGKLALSCTASYVGLPCMGGKSPTANLYLLDPVNKTLHQVAFDQDSDIHPTVLNDGRILYQRWEYSDIPHYFSRRLFTMNPDGSGQLAYYGSNSLFPTTFLFAKPIPGHASRVVGILGGHHDVSECGRLALLDPALASKYPFRFRAKTKEWGREGSQIDIVPECLPAAETGFVQLIPGYGKPVVAHVCDGAHTVAYKKELPSVMAHPYPLADPSTGRGGGKYFLVAMKPAANALWGIYLVDIFDNQTLIAEVEGAALLEPIALKARPTPPVIPDRVQPQKKTAVVHIADIYRGPGLRGVPRGTVKRLRVFSYHYAYNKRGGHNSVGVHSSWDVKRVLGTAKVEDDGSACFTIPANLPVSLQPLDAEGRAVQLMRSWLVGVPGERVSCVGCHEERADTLPPHRGVADSRPAEPLAPWYGTPRPFAFSYEVYPVLEKYCLGCHDGAPSVGPRSKPSFKDPQVAYKTLHPYVRRPGPEADMAIPNPLEYHASTSPLIQMLEKGHHGRKLTDLDREARERIYCWIDLNAPQKGTWNPPEANAFEQTRRRRELAIAFADNATDPEAEYRAALAAFNARTPATFVPPTEKPAVRTDDLQSPGAPEVTPEFKTVRFGDRQSMTFARIPAGEFIMGDLTGYADEGPRTRVRIDNPFWIGVTEVSNGQYAQYDPQHDTRYLDMHGKDHVAPGHIANHPNQPVARISWREATEFCRWLSGELGQSVTLPTEAQWERAARAGTDTQFWYGTLDTDFGRFANLADQGLRWMATSWQGGSTLQKRLPYKPDANFPLHDERFRDNWYVVDYVGQVEANPWGLKDVVGNVNEWTRSDYVPYPSYLNTRPGKNPGTRKVARGGSWADRPVDAGSSVRRAYPPWQKVYDVGFRVVME